MCLSYIISLISISILVYIIFMNYSKEKKEDFYPYRGWGSGGFGGRWGWKKPYINDIGNWRPYEYYPAYSGFWRECSSGSWCPPYVSCRDPACQ